jgi:hypothetical protein
VSVPVHLDALRERINAHGPGAFLITVGEDGHARVVSVSIRYDGSALRVPAGRRTRANLAVNPQLTLLWPPGPDPAYSLIVDGTAEPAAGDEADLVVEPRSAVLHRVATPAIDRF